MVNVPCKLNAHLNYPMECCHHQDCGLIVKTTYLESGDKYITIQLSNGEYRSAIFPKGYPERISMDGQNHACIYMNSPVCLFLGTLI